MDRFELEQRIMRCWEVTLDIQEIRKAKFDRGCNDDTLDNLLLGVEELYNQKFESLWECFETMLREKKI